MKHGYHICPGAAVAGSQPMHGGAHARIQADVQRVRTHWISRTKMSPRDGATHHASAGADSQSV